MLRSTTSIRLSSSAFALLVVGVGAALAALVAHVAIDGVANFVVAHDPYDDLDHASRFVALAAVLAFAVAALGAILAAALSDYGSAGRRLRVLVAAVSRSPWPLVAWSIPLTAAIVVGMEWSDSIAATGAICGLTAAFGGSLILGATIIVACAAATALAVWRVVRFVADADHEIAEALGSFLLGSRIAAAAGSATLAAASAIVDRRSTIVVRRAGDRAPPPSA